jgi:hypothetical protein
MQGGAPVGPVASLPSSEDLSGVVIWRRERDPNP